jgi:aldehyde dehydrogenase (NAD+)
VTEETFGPTLVLRKVADMDEAIALTNASRYALGASIFSRRNGRALAGRVRSGMVAVNSVFSFAMVPSVPFGGVGDSGFGRIHGEDGLREFCYAHAVVRQKFRPPLPLMSFARTAKNEEQLGKIIALVHGRK